MKVDREAIVEQSKQMAVEQGEPKAPARSDALRNSLAEWTVTIILSCSARPPWCRPS
jgi:hypothetical protein